MTRKEVVALLEEHDRQTRAAFDKALVDLCERVNDEVNRALGEIREWMEWAEEEMRRSKVTLRIAQTPTPTRRIIERDENGHIAAIIEQPSEAATG